ncbi:MAG: hypothetical protein RLZZ234_608 [Candidatus Parcubacteria bacterium]
MRGHYKILLALGACTLPALGIIGYTFYEQRTVLLSSASISEQQAFLLVSTACKEKAGTMQDAYEAYLRDCIAGNGYTEDGARTSPSTLTVRDSHSVYQNNTLQFTFTLPQSAALLIDNAPDTESNSAATHSRIVVQGGVMTIVASARTKSPANFAQIVAEYYDRRLNDISLTDGAVERSDTGIETLILTESDASVRILFLSPTKQLIEIHAEEVPLATIHSIAKTLAHTSR